MVSLDKKVELIKELWEKPQIIQRIMGGTNRSYPKYKLTLGYLPIESLTTHNLANRINILNPEHRDEKKPKLSHQHKFGEAGDREIHRSIKSTRFTWQKFTANERKVTPQEIKVYDTHCIVYEASSFVNSQIEKFFHVFCVRLNSFLKVMQT